jgi:hypothetical protein
MYTCGTRAREFLGERLARPTDFCQRKTKFSEGLAQSKSPWVAQEDELCVGAFQLAL